MGRAAYLFSVRTRVKSEGDFERLVFALRDRNHEEDPCHSSIRPRAVASRIVTILADSLIDSLT
jgi:hypothetical protein